MTKPLIDDKKPLIVSNRHSKRYPKPKADLLKTSILMEVPIFVESLIDDRDAPIDNKKALIVDKDSPIATSFAPIDDTKPLIEYKNPLIGKHELP